MSTEQKIKEVVMDNFVSDRLEFSYDDLMEMLYADELPDEVWLVDVFADWYLPYLADHIKDLANDLIRVVVKGVEL